MEPSMSSATAQPRLPPLAEVASSPPGRSITLTDSAVARLQRLLAERNTPEAGLRVAVRGGGCSGLAYHLEWSDHPRDRDKVFSRNGVRIFVDPKSYLYLMGTELVYEETLMSSGFKLHNPNLKSACGCGDSFTV
jgi:iron-sulfur cluster assembly protein